MAKLKQSSASAGAGTPLIWRLYPLAWCLIGVSAGVYVFTSETSTRVAAFLASDGAVSERRVADSETRASIAARQLERAKQELREERSRVVALNIRVDQLNSELRAANAGRLTASSTASDTAKQQQPDTAAAPAPVVTTTVVNTTPVTAPDTSRLVTVNAPPTAPATVATADPNAPPVPVRVPQQARAAALAENARANIAQATSSITTGSLAANPLADPPKPAERAPTTAAAPPSTLSTAPQPTPETSANWAATPTPLAPTTNPAATQAQTASASSAALRLATAPSITSLRQSWSILVSRHPDILQGLSPRYRDITSASGRSFQLIAGPLLSRGEAIQLCAMLQVQAVGCGVDTYAGAPL